MSTATMEKPVASAGAGGKKPPITVIIATGFGKERD